MTQSPDRNLPLCHPWSRILKGASSQSLNRVLPVLKHAANYSFAVALLTAAHGSKFYNEPRLTAGELAPETLVAPFAAEIVDPEATAALEAQIRAEATQFLQVDPRANAQMQDNLARQLQIGEELRQSVGLPPYIPRSLLSLAAQQYFQQLLPEEWEALLAAIDGAVVEELPTEALLPASELGGLRQELLSPSNEGSISFAELVARIEAAQQRYQLTRGQLQETGWSPDLLQWSSAEWTDVKRTLPEALRRLQAIGLAQGLPPDLQREGIAAQLESLPESLRPVAIQLLDSVVQPNLLINRQLTQEQLQSQLDRMQPVTIAVERGSDIVMRGEPIDSTQFAILDHYNLTQRRLNVGGLLQVGGMMAGAIAIFVPLQNWIRPTLRSRDRLLLLLLASTVAPTASIFGVQSSALPAVGLLAGSFYGGLLGLLVLGGAAALLPVATEVTAVTLGPVLAGSLLACLVAPRLRSREDLALLGGGAALTQAATYGLLSLATGNPFQAVQMAIAGGSGLLWSVAALGASPNLELLFDLVTPIRLAELANPNRPLLRRLADEAPGTFQHTLFVASLAERAAQRLKLNAELVRTGTLYHDIGKMLRAQYFIENLKGAPNPHEALNNPYRSAEIIRDHVSDGLKLARQYRLPTAIRAFIPEHQGTIRIAYFYHQAQVESPNNPPEEAAFRYDGPIPQTRETGVVMLADACEAALRSLRKREEGEEVVSPEMAKRMILSIFRNRWEDGQLVDSGLMRKDLEAIAEVFLQVWQDSSHERIRYPQPLMVGAGRSV
ncbi:HD family phosphohydrolase [Synechococcus sp. PCC 7336]|uniref:HD family phosphohydrolase n=1 Tax=Synechococcus sp. PCC 7336 TaxID=195250 RepID=UPI0003622E27|nr:HDIG domain-containing metalloprotein [Synechococcus sp. PCC 7336]